MEHIAIAWQPCQTFLSKAALLLGHGAGGIEAVERWVGGFFVFLIAADRLADDGFVADNVEDVVGDLERQTDVLAVAAERSKLLFVRTADDGPDAPVLWAWMYFMFASSMCLPSARRSCA